MCLQAHPAPFLLLSRVVLASRGCRDRGWDCKGRKFPGSYASSESSEMADNLELSESALMKCNRACMLLTLLGPLHPQQHLAAAYLASGVAALGMARTLLQACVTALDLLHTKVVRSGFTWEQLKVLRCTDASVSWLSACFSTLLCHRSRLDHPIDE